MKALHYGEDNASSDGTYEDKDIVNKRKQSHYLNHHFNAAASPDIAPIENCWGASKQWLEQIPYWSDESVIDLVESWDHHLPQRSMANESPVYLDASFLIKYVYKRMIDRKTGNRIVNCMVFQTRNPAWHPDHFETRLA